jgi:hypothetical protein
LFTVSNETVEQVAFDEKTIKEFGTVRVYGVPLAVNAMVEFVKVTLVPLLGTPVAVKLALNQM